MENNIKSSSESNDSVADFLFNLDSDFNLGTQSESLENKKSATIYNLNSKILDDNTVKLLETGLKFVPSPTYFDEVEFQADLDNLANKVRFACTKPTIQYKQNENLANQSFIKPTFTHFAPSSKDHAVNSACHQITNIRPEYKSSKRRNMSPEFTKH